MNLYLQQAVSISGRADSILGRLSRFQVGRSLFQAGRKNNKSGDERSAKGDSCPRPGPRTKVNAMYLRRAFPKKKFKWPDTLIMLVLPNSTTLLAADFCHGFKGGFVLAKYLSEF